MELTVRGHAVYAATGGRPLSNGLPAILFIHGAGQDHTCWQMAARYFAWRGHNVVALDLPGHGRTEGAPLSSIVGVAGWIGEVMDVLELAQASLVGHSMGSAIALEAAAGGPRITRVALFGAGLTMPVNPALLQAALTAPEHAAAMIVGWGYGPRAKIGGNAMPGMWMTGAATALLARNRPGVLHADLAACQAWTSGREAAARVRCPALVVLGARDVMTPPSAGEALAGCLAAGRALRIADCGHVPMTEAPDAFLDALIQFWRASDQHASVG